MAEIVNLVSEDKMYPNSVQFLDDNGNGTFEKDVDTFLSGNAWDTINSIPYPMQNVDGRTTAVYDWGQHAASWVLDTLDYQF